MSDFIEKPPIGVICREYWDQLRFSNIHDAMQRYYDANKEIPEEWIEEYDELLNKYKYKYE